jgi:hypothetical protein
MSSSNLVSAVLGASALPVTRRPNQVQEFAVSGRKLKNLVRADRLGRTGDRRRWRETRFDTEPGSEVRGASALPLTHRPNQVLEFALGGPKLKNLVRADCLRRSGDCLPWRETRFDTVA